ncbi:MAG: hypothetical protein ACKN89_02710 [Cyanobium sp.]|jgi:hypothetical protein|nr:hypothetical protein [Synechococcaceae cyanobacterium]
MSEPTIHLDLTIEEVNLILDALGEQPFKTVFTLVSRLQSQARSQLQSSAPSATAAMEPPSREPEP